MKGDDGIFKIKLTALQNPKSVNGKLLVDKEFAYTDVLSSGNFGVDLSEFYDEDEIESNLEVFDRNGKKIAIE